jgi:hypothetical protein
VPRSRTPLVLGAAAVLVVVLLTVLGAPTWLRTALCLPLLVGVSGAAISANVLPLRASVDALTRIALLLLFGVVSLVFAGLVVALVFRDGLDADRVVLTHTAVALVALGGFALRSPGGVTPARTRPSARTTGGPSAWASVAAGLLLLVVAVVLGRSFLPSASNSPTFALTGRAGTESGPLVATPGSEVALDWAVRQAGALPAGQPVQAVMDGRAVDVLSDVTPISDGSYAGRAVVLAPNTVGLHRVVLSLPLPDQRLELVAYVDVRPA